MDQAVKMLKDDGDSFVIGGYGVVWGGKDLAGEFFVPTTASEKGTDFWFDRITYTPPLLWSHGFDPFFKSTVIGRVTKIAPDDVGLWIEAQIRTAKEYADAIRRLVGKEVVGLSSGAVAHLVEKQASGKITVWPIAEWSALCTPCEPRTLGVSAVRSLAEHEPALKSLLATSLKAEWSTAYKNDLPDSCFLYVGDGGSKDADGKTTPRSLRHFPYKDTDGSVDVPHLRNALGRIPQSDLPTDVKARALAKAQRLAKENGIGDDEMKALMEGADTAGGYAADGTGEQPTHPHDAMAHEHSHGDGMTHSHAHDHADGSLTHEGDAHDHSTVAAPMKAKARKDVDGDDEDDGADYEGSYEDLHADLESLVNPSGPLTSSYNRVVATYPGHVVFCSWEDGDESYFQVSYRVGPDGEPMLTGQPTAVEQAWQPVKAVALVSLELNARDIGRRQAAFLAGTKGLLERRVKEGREFSTRNESALMDHADRLDGHAKESTDMAGSIRGMVTASRSARDARTKAEYLATPEARKLALDLLQLYAATLEPETVPA